MGQFPGGRDQVLITLGLTGQTWGEHIWGNEPASALQLPPGTEPLFRLRTLLQASRGVS